MDCFTIVIPSQRSSPKSDGSTIRVTQNSLPVEGKPLLLHNQLPARLAAQQGESTHKSLVSHRDRAPLFGSSPCLPFSPRACALSPVCILDIECHKLAQNLLQTRLNAHISKFKGFPGHLLPKRWTSSLQSPSSCGSQRSAEPSPTCVRTWILITSVYSRCNSQFFPEISLQRQKYPPIIYPII